MCVCFVLCYLFVYFVAIKEAIMSDSEYDTSVQDQDHNKDPDEDPDEDTDEEDIPDECGICGEEFGDVLPTSTCIACKTRICDDCATKDVYQYSDWIFMGTRCDRCHANVCRDCVRFCHDCFNDASDFSCYCPKCCPKDIVDVPCEFHVWTTCPRDHAQHHKPYQCGECFANANYAGKYSM